ncbi:hypothetical protein LguiB_021792 [Lonicera macranthoides]
MAEGLALGIAQKGLGQLSSLAFREIGLALGAESELQELKLTITTIRTTLLNAEKRQLKSDREILWLERLKRVCYAADDIVDEFEIKALKQQVVLSSMQRRRFKTKVLLFFSCSNPLIFPFRIGHQIKDVREQCGRIAFDRSLYGYKDNPENEPKRNLFLMSSYPCVPVEFTIDEDSENIMTNLLMDSSGPECFQAISIVGIAGIGKTTLANTVYNDPRVSQHFQLRIWASVDNDFILKTLLVWLDVQHNKSWTFNEKDCILQPLIKSYEQLPPHLKICFAYCSTFPKKFAVLGIELIYLWIAQGLIQPTNQATHELEKIGQEYIRELMSRLFFQDIDGNGYFSTIKMHGLVYELAQLVAPTEYSNVDFPMRDIPRTFLHLSFDSSHPFPKEGIPSHLHELQHVRSLIFQPGADPNRSLVEKCIKRFNRLRMLDLTNSNFETLPSSIADSKHLRYLDLSWNKNIKSLPNSICELQSLQTLGLQGCMRLEKLPKDIAKLISLRCLRLTTRERCLPAKAIGSLKSLRFLLVDECDNLVHMFDGEGIVMQNLLFLVIKNCKNLVSLPQGLSCLTALENLEIVNCEKLDLAEDSGSSSGGGGGDRGLKGLHYLSIGELPALVALPRWLLQHATATLNHIRITNCGNFAAFPEELDCLQRLWIERCPRLACLPDEMSCLPKMEEIRISECPQLIEACWRETGQYWDKVSHVRDIYLDGINIQDPFNNPSQGNSSHLEEMLFEDSLQSKACGGEI